MCTVTWLLQKDGYQLFFNRDELKTRQIAHPPVIDQNDGVKYIAPVDADAGGSWLGVNEYGLSIGILNFYHANTGKPDPNKAYISRGLLLKSLLSSIDRQMVFFRLEKENLYHFRPFMLVIWEPGENAATCTWEHSGNPLYIEKNAAFPLTSSSFKAGQVIEDRLKLFYETASPEQDINARFLTEFHQSHVPKAGPYSVCMHREDAQTVSFSQVTVTPERVEFYYIPGSPCQNSFLPPVRLLRIPKPVSDEKSDFT